MPAELPSPLPEPRYVLASASPRRAELLARAGLDFEARPVDCDESWRPGEPPVDYARRVAAAKASAAAELILCEAPVDERGLIILAADTTVWLDPSGAPLGKPRDREHARRMLRALTEGRQHWVTTACVILRFGPGEDPAIAEHSEVVETTAVHMRALNTAEFEAFIGPYLERAAWTDKAGAYAIQGQAAALVTRIEGSYTAVVGLPLAQVVAHLATL